MLETWDKWKIAEGTNFHILIINQKVKGWMGEEVVLTIKLKKNKG